MGNALVDAYNLSSKNMVKGHGERTIMGKMKAIAASVAVFAIALALAGCGGGASGTASSAGGSQAAQPSSSSEGAFSEGVDTPCTVSYSGQAASAGEYFLAEGTPSP